MEKEQSPGCQFAFYHVFQGRTKGSKGGKKEENKKGQFRERKGNGRKEMGEKRDRGFKREGKKEEDEKN